MPKYFFQDQDLEHVKAAVVASIESFLDAAAEAVVITDHQDQIGLINFSAEKLFEYEKQELIDKPLTKIIPSSDLLVKQASLKSSSWYYPRELNGLTKLGHDVPIQVNVSSFPIFDQILTVYFITDLRVRKSIERRARLYLQVANAMILVLDLKGKILMINQKGCDILGYDEAQILGKNWFVHFIPKDIRSELTNVHEQIASNGDKSLEFYENKILVKGNKIRVIEWHNALIRDEAGEISSVISSGVDITSRRKAEAAAIEAIHKGQDLERERIAQELHDGLGQQLAAAKMLLSSVESDFELMHPDKINIIADIKHALTHAIDDARNISHNLAPAALNRFGLFSAIKNICLKMEIASPTKISFKKMGSDQGISKSLATGIYRIVQELLTNMLKHSNATAASVCLCQHENKLELTVTDNGIGFNHTYEESMNNGIGLRNITSRVQSLNGKLEIDSQQGLGTSVKIRIPL